MNHEFYLKALEVKLVRYYRTYKNGEPTLEQRGELHGFMEAALLLEAVSKEQLETVIDAQHRKVFGKSIKQRRKDLFDSTSEDFDWDYFDKPLWERETRE